MCQFLQAVALKLMLSNVTKINSSAGFAQRGKHSFHERDKKNLQSLQDFFFHPKKDSKCAISCHQK
jgi:hypothetical protein